MPINPNNSNPNFTPNPTFSVPKPLEQVTSTLPQSNSSPFQSQLEINPLNPLDILSETENTTGTGTPISTESSLSSSTTEELESLHTPSNNTSSESPEIHPNMTTTSNRTPDMMPLMGQKGAPPKFKGSYGEVHKFLRKYEQICTSYNLSEVQKCEYIVDYTSHKVSLIIEGFKGYGEKKWDKLKSEVIKHFDAAKRDNRHKTKDLRKLVKETKHQRIRSLSDWRHYQRKFAAVGGWLLNHGKIDEKEYLKQLWFGIDSRFRKHTLGPDLKLKEPKEKTGDPWPEDTIDKYMERYFARGTFEEEESGSDSDSSEDSTSDSDSDSDSDSSESSSSSDSDSGGRYKSGRKGNNKVKKGKKSIKKKPKASKSIGKDSAASSASTEKAPLPPNKDEVEELIDQLSKMSIDDPQYSLTYYKAIKLDPECKSFLTAPAARIPTLRSAPPPRPTLPRSDVARDLPPHMDPNRPPPRQCFGCGEIGHGLRYCPKVNELVKAEKVTTDPNNRYVMKNTGQSIRRNFNETIVQAYERMVKEGTHQTNFVAEMDPYTSEDESYNVGYESDTEPDDTLNDDMEVLAADRTDKSINQARKQVFDGVHLPPKGSTTQKARTADRRQLNQPQEVTRQYRTRAQDRPQPFNKAPIANVPVPTIPDKPIPMDVRKPRFDPKEVKDIEMDHPTVNIPNAAPNHKQETSKPLVNKENTGIEPKPITQPAQLEGKRLPRQAEIAKDIKPEQILKSILSTPVTITMHELLGTSKDLSDQMIELLKRKNIKPIVAHSYQASEVKGFLILLDIVLPRGAVRAIVDTGSQLNIMKKSVYETYVMRPVDMTRRVVMKDANGGTKVLTGLSSNVELECGNVSTQGKFWLGEKLPFDVLLGRPWQLTNLVSVEERVEGTYLVFRKRDDPEYIRETCVGRPQIISAQQSAPEFSAFLSETPESLTEQNTAKGIYDEPFSLYSSEEVGNDPLEIPYILPANSSRALIYEIETQESLISPDPDDITNGNLNPEIANGINLEEETPNQGLPTREGTAGSEEVMIGAVLIPDEKKSVPRITSHPSNKNGLPIKNSINLDPEEGDMGNAECRYDPNNTEPNTQIGYIAVNPVIKGREINNDITGTPRKVEENDKRNSIDEIYGGQQLSPGLLEDLRESIGMMYKKRGRSVGELASPEPEPGTNIEFDRQNRQRSILGKWCHIVRRKLAVQTLGNKEIEKGDQKQDTGRGSRANQDREQYKFIGKVQRIFKKKNPLDPPNENSVQGTSYSGLETKARSLINDTRNIWTNKRTTGIKEGTRNRPKSPENLTSKTTKPLLYTTANCLPSTSMDSPSFSDSSSLKVEVDSVAKTLSEHSSCFGRCGEYPSSSMSHVTCGAVPANHDGEAVAHALRHGKDAAGNECEQRQRSPSPPPTDLHLKRTEHASFLGASVQDLDLTLLYPVTASSDEDGYPLSSTMRSQTLDSDSVHIPILSIDSVTTSFTSTTNTLSSGLNNSYEDTRTLSLDRNSECLEAIEIESGPDVASQRRACTNCTINHGYSYCRCGRVGREDEIMVRLPRSDDWASTDQPEKETTDSLPSSPYRPSLPPERSVRRRVDSEPEPGLGKDLLSSDELDAHDSSREALDDAVPVFMVQESLVCTPTYARPDLNNIVNKNDENGGNCPANASHSRPLKRTYAYANLVEDSNGNEGEGMGAEVMEIEDMEREGRMDEEKRGRTLQRRGARGKVARKRQLPLRRSAQGKPSPLAISTSPDNDNDEDGDVEVLKGSESSTPLTEDGPTMAMDPTQLFQVPSLLLTISHLSPALPGSTLRFCFRPEVPAHRGLELDEGLVMAGTVVWGLNEERVAELVVHNAKGKLVTVGLAVDALFPDEPILLSLQLFPHTRPIEISMERAATVRDATSKEIARLLSSVSPVVRHHPSVLAGKATFYVARISSMHAKVDLLYVPKQITPKQHPLHVHFEALVPLTRRLETSELAIMPGEYSWRTDKGVEKRSGELVVSQEGNGTKLGMILGIVPANERTILSARIFDNLPIINALTLALSTIQNAAPPDIADLYLQLDPRLAHRQKPWRGVATVFTSPPPIITPCSRNQPKLTFSYGLGSPRPDYKFVSLLSGELKLLPGEITELEGKMEHEENGYTLYAGAKVVLRRSEDGAVILCQFYTERLHRLLDVPCTVSMDLDVQPLPYAWIPSLVKEDLDMQRYSSLPPLMERSDVLALTGMVSVNAIEPALIYAVASTDIGRVQEELASPDGMGVRELACLQYDHEEAGQAYEFTTEEPWELGRNEERVLRGVFRWKDGGEVKSSEGKIGICRIRGTGDIFWEAETERFNLETPCTITLSVPSDLASVQWISARLLTENLPSSDTDAPLHQGLKVEPISTVKFLADIPMNDTLQPRDTIIMTGYLESEDSREMYKVPAEIRVRMKEDEKKGVEKRASWNPFPFSLPSTISTNLRVRAAWTGTEIEVLLMPRMTATGESVPASKVRRYSIPFVLKAQKETTDLMLAEDVTREKTKGHKGLMVYFRAREPLPELTLFKFTTVEPVERKMQLGEREVIDGFIQWQEEEEGAREVPAKMTIECRKKSDADKCRKRVSNNKTRNDRVLTCSNQTWDSVAIRPPILLSTNLCALCEDSGNYVECGLLLDNCARRELAERTSNADPFYPISTASSPLVYHLDPDSDTFLRRSQPPKPVRALLPVDHLHEAQGQEGEKPPQFRIETEEGLFYSVPLPSHIRANTESLPKATTRSNPVNESLQALAQCIGFLLDNACEVQDRPDLVHPLVIVTQYATLQNPRQLHGMPVYEGTGTEALFLYVNEDGEPAVRKGSFTYQANFDPYYLYLTPEAYGSNAEHHSHELLLIQAHNGKHLSSSEQAPSTTVAQEPTWLQGADGGHLPSPANAMASFLGVQEGDWDPNMSHVLACAEDDNASTSSSMPGLIAGSDDEGERVTTAEQEEDGDDFPACTETELIPITAQHIYTDSNPHPHLYADPRVLSGTSSISLAQDVERHRWTTLAHSGGADVRARALEHLRRLGSNTREGRTTLEDILGALNGQRPYPPSMFVSRILPVLKSQNTPPSANPREEPTRDPRRDEDYPVMQPSLLATVLGSFSDPQDPAPAYSPHPDTITMYVGMVLQAFRERFVRRDAPVSTILIQPSDPRVRQVMMAGPRRSEVVILNRNVAGFELVKKAIEVSPTFAAYGRGLEVLGTVGAVASAVRKSIMVMMRSGILPIPGYTPFPINASPERMFRELLEGYTPVFPEEIPVARFIYLVAHLLNEFVDTPVIVLQTNLRVSPIIFKGL
ncbi:hypothetical protein VKT23_004648 [Stygiomarasmius scandens]|uniref:CCHC-type domain-containing protein n=1 Tax=Marasmiellus scandens TaxID=2682957 RepID=A0ABR1JVI1_9AGAR